MEVPSDRAIGGDKEISKASLNTSRNFMNLKPGTVLYVWRKKKNSFQRSGIVQPNLSPASRLLLGVNDIG
jgi:hypothetical protein